MLLSNTLRFLLSVRRPTPFKQHLTVVLSVRRPGTLSNTLRGF